MSRVGDPSTFIYVVKVFMIVYSGCVHTSHRRGWLINVLFRAAVMTWTLYFLATHPEVEQKLVNEIQQVLGVDESGYQCKVTPENIDQLVYGSCSLCHVGCRRWRSWPSKTIEPFVTVMLQSVWTILMQYRLFVSQPRCCNCLVIWLRNVYILIWSLNFLFDLFILVMFK